MVIINLYLRMMGSVTLHLIGWRFQAGTATIMDKDLFHLSLYTEKKQTIVEAKEVRISDRRTISRLHIS